MLSNGKLIEIASDAAEIFNGKDGRFYQKWFWDRTASVMIDALRAAGAIPAEGTVCVDAARWERVLALAQAAVRLDGATAMKVVETEDQYVLYGMARNSEECRIALWSAVIGMGGIRPGDLDAVLDPTEPLQAPAQTP